MNPCLTIRVTASKFGAQWMNHASLPLFGYLGTAQQCMRDRLVQADVSNMTFHYSAVDSNKQPAGNAEVIFGARQ